MGERTTGTKIKFPHVWRTPSYLRFCFSSNFRSKLQIEALLSSSKRCYAHDPSAKKSISRDILRSSKTQEASDR